MIEIRGLKKTFKHLNVLKGVDLTVNDGDVVCIVGPSGSGKSTLLRCINGIEKASGGHIIIDGVDATDHKTNMDHLREKVGFVFQNFNLFPHMTVAKNIMLAPTKVLKIPENKAYETALDLLGKVGLLDKVDAHPAQLSGGQQQRVAIARALAMHPKYMLFDEPTSALDPEMIGEVLDVILKLAQSGMTMIIVTHEMKFAQEVATSIVFMDDGLVLEQAPPDKFFSNPESPRAVEFIGKIL